MKGRIKKALKDRPIISVILCVALSEILQFIFSWVFDIPQAVYYGITVVALLILFVIPVVLYVIEKRKGEK